MSNPTITIVGNLGADPEMRFTSDGTPVVNLRVAQSRWRGPERDPETDWYRCTAWRDLAENIAESVSKGDRVVVYGQLKSRVVEAEDGGQKATFWDLDIEAIGPDLRFATASPSKTGGKSQGAARPSYNQDEEPF